MFYDITNYNVLMGDLPCKYKKEWSRIEGGGKFGKQERDEGREMVVKF